MKLGIVAASLDGGKGSAVNRNAVFVELFNHPLVFLDDFIGHILALVADIVYAYHDNAVLNAGDVDNVSVKPVLAGSTQTAENSVSAYALGCNGYVFGGLVCLKPARQLVGISCKSVGGGACTVGDGVAYADDCLCSGFAPGFKAA